uniref:Uncharacterized protein n=1 Tax=Romanomermis culicivorax TaxID=13658 RepID=A0A915KBA5_ROMCU
MQMIFITFITTLKAAYEAYAPFLTTIDINVLASTFWEEASIDFKSWWKSQHGELYWARTKPLWGFIKPLHQMLENPTLDDEQLAWHLWNILPPSARAQWIGTDQKYINHCIALALPRF